MDERKEGASRNRRLLFDPVSFHFYFESPEQAVAKTCNQRQKLVTTVNRCEQKKLEGTLKRFEGHHHIFENKLSGEIDLQKANLQEMKAHANALKAVAKVNGVESHLGKYRQNATKKNLHQLIELEKKKMTPQWIRRERTETLLRQQPQMLQLDCKMDTAAIFATWRRTKWKTRRVILPQIQVQFDMDKSLLPNNDVVFITQLEKKR
jgi:hypothetical protein